MLMHWTDLLHKRKSFLFYYLAN